MELFPVLTAWESDSPTQVQLECLPSLSFQFPKSPSNLNCKSANSPIRESPLTVAGCAPTSSSLQWQRSDNNRWMAHVVAPRCHSLIIFVVTWSERRTPFPRDNCHPGASIRESQGGSTVGVPYSSYSVQVPHTEDPVSGAIT